MEDRRDDWSQCIHADELEVTPKDNSTIDESDIARMKGYYAMFMGRCSTCERVDECSLYAEYHYEDDEDSEEDTDEYLDNPDIQGSCFDLLNDWD